MESGVVAKDDNDNAGFGIGIATGDNMTQQENAMAKGHIGKPGRHMGQPRSRHHAREHAG